MALERLPEICAEAEPVAPRRFSEAGFRIYLVGGIVRDLWLDRPIVVDHDLDLTTDALPTDTKSVLSPIAEAIWTQGERFGTIGARVFDRTYEVTTHRSEIYANDSRKPSVAFSTAIEQDLSRRDFTVNAMAISLPDQELVDPFGGVEDLRARRLATPVDPEISFGDDPLRMLRAARFVAGYGLEPVADLTAAMSRLAARIEIVSVERVRDELDKLLALRAPSAGLALLESTGLAGLVLPGRRSSIGGEPGRRSSTAIEHQAIDLLTPRADLRLAALLCEGGADHARSALRDMRYPTSLVAATARTIAAAEQVDEALLDPASFRRWYAKVGDRCADALELAQYSKPGLADLVGELLEVGDALRSDLEDLSIPLDGDDVMAITGLAEGPQVGEAVAMLRELRLDNGPLEREVAQAAVETWWRERNDN